MNPGHFQMITNDASVKNFGAAPPLVLTGKLDQVILHSIFNPCNFPVPLQDDTKLIEIMFTIDNQETYPYCTTHASAVNPYGLGMIPASTSERGAKLFLCKDKYILQYKVSDHDSNTTR